MQQQRYYSIPVKWEIGTKFTAQEIEYKVIGYEYVVERGTRYILMCMVDGTTQFVDWYGFEIEEYMSEV